MMRFEEWYSKLVWGAALLIPGHFTNMTYAADLPWWEGQVTSTTIVCTKIEPILNYYTYRPPRDGEALDKAIRSGVCLESKRAVQVMLGKNIHVGTGSEGFLFSIWQIKTKDGMAYDQPQYIGYGASIKGKPNQAARQINEARKDPSREFKSAPKGKRSTPSPDRLA